jgi:hypothetical protein
MPESETFEFVLSAGANAFTGYYAKGRQKFTWTGTRESRPPSTLVSRWSADGNAGGNDLRVSWFGLLDEVQFHNRALTAEEIRAITRK